MTMLRHGCPLKHRPTNDGRRKFPPQSTATQQFSRMHSHVLAGKEFYDSDPGGSDARSPDIYLGMGIFFYSITLIFTIRSDTQVTSTLPKSHLLFWKTNLSLSPWGVCNSPRELTANVKKIAPNFFFGAESLWCVFFFANPSPLLGGERRFGPKDNQSL